MEGGRGLVRESGVCGEAEVEEEEGGGLHEVVGETEECD